MLYRISTVTTLLLLFCFHGTTSFHHSIAYYLASGTGALISSAVFYWKVGVPWQEHCSRSWLNFNVEEFRGSLQEHLYGQHLVEKVVTNSLRAHLSKAKPKKALVMSFHGWTGSGKNYATKLIVNALYPGEAQSSFVKWYIATRDFPHASEVKNYREKLQKEITEQTKLCALSIFIFDEMDKMNPGVIDAIKPYIDFYEDIDGVDYRKNIFIFLSNAGGSEITRVAFNFWLDGKDREDIDMRDIEPLITQGAFNEIGGLQHSEIVRMNLIDVYVPFLPLERRHIKQCITYELKSRGLKINTATLENVADQIIFYPPQFELFSISGCKKISHKVDLYAFEEL